MRILILTLCVFYTPVAFAQKDQKGSKPGVVEVKFDEESTENPFQISDATKRYQNEKLIAKLRRKFCRKYNKKYIAYYNNIYYVESCKRKRLESSAQQFEVTRRKKKIQTVDAEVIAVIPEGEVMNQVGKTKRRRCRDLQNHYVTFSDVDVYFVERCKLRIFPDWESYISHRNKRKKDSEILALTWEEFNTFPEGKPMNSVLDKEYSVAQELEKDVDIIPVDEACRGLNGRYVSYYSRMYKIERCRKRELNPERFWAKHSGRSLKVKELTSEQWVSLPAGKPIKL